VRGAPNGRSELPLAPYAHVADRDPLTAVVLERVLAGWLMGSRSKGFTRASTSRKRTKTLRCGVQTRHLSEQPA
jgi:hypothetical protein